MSKTNHGEAQMEIVEVNPKKAAEWLGTMVSNRPLSDSRVMEYALSMERGEWVLNGETLKFDSHGNLIDGQHRLQASLLADKPFRTYVVWNVVAPKAFATIDVGKTRTNGDIFALSGVPDQNNVSATAKLVCMVKRKLITTGGPRTKAIKKNGADGRVVSVQKKESPSAADLITFAMPHKDRLVESVRLVHRMGFKKLAPISVLAAAYFLFFEKDEAQAASFMRDLSSGAGLKANDAVYRLRERLVSNLASNAKLTRWAVFALVIKAWNKRRAGEPCGTLKLVEGEKFPIVQ